MLEGVGRIDGFGLVSGLTRGRYIVQIVHIGLCNFLPCRLLRLFLEAVTGTFIELVKVLTAFVFFIAKE